MVSLHFDIRYQYALRTTSLGVQPVSANTLYNFRHRLYEYYETTGIDLIQEEMEAHAKLIIKELEIDGKNYRMDSLMVSSSCKKLTRIALIFETNKKCIKHIEKNYPNKMSDSLKEYLDKDYKQDILYRENYDNYDDKLIDMLGHSVEIYNVLSSLKSTVNNSKIFELIQRLISDQIIFDAKGSIKATESKEIPPTSMHSPTDPDATYRTKYGSNIGYVGNVVEHFDKDNAIIEYYDYQKNVYSDISFSEDTIKKIEADKSECDNAEENSDKTVMLVDGAYYGQALANDALDKDIIFVPTNLVGRRQQTDQMAFIEFELDEKRDCIVKCPNGKTPVITVLKDNKEKLYSAKFSKGDCENCPLKTRCPIIEQQKYNTLRVKKNRYQTELLRVKMKTDDHREIAKQRAAIEGIPSILRRVYRVDTMYVRGLVRTKIWFGLKIGTINIKRLIKSRLAIC